MVVFIIMQPALVQFGGVALVQFELLVAEQPSRRSVTAPGSQVGTGMLYAADNASNKGDFHPRKKEQSIRESVHKDILPTLTPIKREALPSPDKKDIIKHKDV